MPISKDTIRQVGHLARIGLTDEELATFSEQLREILSFIDTLRECDTEAVSPTSHILPLSNVFRNDEKAPSLPAEDILAAAPKKQDNLFVVPRVIE